MAATSPKEARQFVTCMQCANATLMQWFDNPVVCECSEKTVIRFVANARKICNDFVPLKGEPKIKHYDTYEESNEMFRGRSVDALRAYLREQVELIKSGELDKKDKNVPRLY